MTTRQARASRRAPQALLAMVFAVAVIASAPGAAASAPPATPATASDPRIIVPTPGDPGPRPGPPVLKRALVVTVGFTGSGTTPKGLPDKSVSLVANTVTNEVNPWFEKVSHGLFAGFSTARMGPVRVSPLAAVCSEGWHDEVAALADAASRRQGIDPRNYDNVIYYFGRLSVTPACAATGWGDQLGRRVWLNGTTALATLVHELGHNLGLGHAGAQYCADRNGVRVPLSGPLNLRCTQVEYGDAYSAMGGRAGIPKSYSSAELARLGWNNGRVTTVFAGDPGVTQVLRTLEDDAPGKHALRLVDGGTTLWVEYRHDPSDPTRPALLVRAEQPSRSGSINPAPFLLDMSPDDGDHQRGLDQYQYQQMAVGQAWSNPLGRITITLSSADAHTAAVTVQSAPDSASLRVVPDVIGDTPATATNRIFAAGLVRGTSIATVDCESLGKVTSQSPVAGTQLPAGGVVDIRYGVQRPGGCGIPQ